MNRRSLLKLACAGAASSVVGLPVLRAFADAPQSRDDAFVFIHASGGWDVTLWADPRNEKQGLVAPATDEYVDVAALKHWTPMPASTGGNTFELVQRDGFALGPALGDLTDMFDRVTIFNGLAMETVSHIDGTYYSSTGRHLAGGRPLATSVDTLLASELGATDLLPLVSVEFPSTFLSRSLDARATPLRMNDVTAVGKALRRSEMFTTSADRTAVTALLANEAAELARGAYDPAPADRMRLQYEALERMLADKSVLDTFDDAKLRAAQPSFFTDAAGSRIVRSFYDDVAVSAAFAVEAIKKKICRCVSFNAKGFDTHSTDYTEAGLRLQELFDIVANMVRRFDADGMSNRVHIVVISDFCRTPQINARSGRDHYPNNSALVISPRIRAKRVYGKTNPLELLPADSVPTAGGQRKLTPPDLLATLLGSMGINPRKHMRDGEILKELLV
jgi:uncharacterized protein (DUF1501 family)